MCIPKQLKVCSDLECIVCKPRRLITIRPDRTIFWSKNNIEQPFMVTSGILKKFEFDCPDCFHSFLMSPRDICNGKWCPYCNGVSLCNNSTCQFCYNKSFASHPLSKLWTNENECNPREILYSSRAIRHFKCDKCQHKFSQSPNKIESLNYCPYCNSRRLCENPSCLFCYNGSFASHPMSVRWTDKNELIPRQIFKQSNIVGFFYCPDCCHNYQLNIRTIIGNGTMYPCSYCGGNQLCDKQDCYFCFNNSLASHPYAKNLSIKNTIPARSVKKGTRKYKFIFNCPDCKIEFQSTPANINYGSSCPYCRCKTENKLYKWLISNFSQYEIIRQFKPEWCRNPQTQYHLPFDFLVKELHLIIELDGGQHFFQVASWKTPDEQRSRDIYKMKQAYTNNYSIIRIYQMDVWLDLNNWEIKLNNAIRSYDRPEFICIEGGIDYSKHLEELSNITLTLDEDDNIEDENNNINNETLNLIEQLRKIRIVYQ